MEKIIVITICQGISTHGNLTWNLILLQKLLLGSVKGCMGNTKHGLLLLTLKNTDSRTS